jgi:hypothetical protein
MNNMNNDFDRSSFIRSCSGDIIPDPTSGKKSGFTTLLSYRGHRVVSWPASAPAVGCSGFAYIFASKRKKSPVFRLISL